MIITYKIIHGLVCVPCSEFFAIGYYKIRGVARILQWGFPLVVDPRRGGLGAQPSEADE